MHDFTYSWFSYSHSTYSIFFDWFQQKVSRVQSILTVRPRFVLAKSSFDRQYAQVYYLRLTKMRQAVRILNYLVFDAMFLELTYFPAKIWWRISGSISCCCGLASIRLVQITIHLPPPYSAFELKWFFSFCFLFQLFLARALRQMTWHTSHRSKIFLMIASAWWPARCSRRWSWNRIFSMNSTKWYELNSLHFHFLGGNPPMLVDVSSSDFDSSNWPFSFDRYHARFFCHRFVFVCFRKR